MKVSLNWLKELVKYDLSAKDLAEKLSLTSIGVKTFNDNFLELDLTYNRGDLLSLRGVAREVAAITGSNLAGSEPTTYEVEWKELPKTPVKIEDEDLSPLQCVAKIEGLKVQKSNENWVKRLSECGMRSVNNIADVTNLIMLEYGQPLHAFDEATVEDDTINVRVAKKGEEIVTLDNKLRKLETSDIVLADTKKPLDVAGVMGGKDTEVKESTHTILLSASMFNPVMVRKTAQRLGLHSEASKRFQHGLTKTNLIQALITAIKMYEDLGGKLTAITMVGVLEDKPRSIKLNKEKIDSLLGVEIPITQIESSLISLGFSVNAAEVTVPYWRLDCNIEEDLVEEVARIYGYDKLLSTPLPKDKPIKIDQSLYEFLDKVKNSCKGAGLTEVSTYSFYSTDVLNNLEIDKNLLIKIANPISSETEYLRFTLWENLVEATAKNVKSGFKDIAIFEVGKTYRPKKGTLPDENYELSIALVNGSDNPVAELFEILEKIMEGIGIKLELSEMKDDPASEKLFHPKRAKFIDFKGEPIGGLVEIHPRIVNKFGIEQRVAIAELSIVPLLPQLK